MCVIALCSEDRRLSEWMVEDMYAANAYGAGIAYRVFDKKLKKPIVKWEKGLDLDGIKAAALTAPLPYCAHFRVPTCGPRDGIFAPLTHPFPISPQVELLEVGEYDGPVLFHNGVWTGWESKVQELAIRTGNKIPVGKWSDSRAMAWFAHVLGLGILDFINEKAVVFGPEEIFMVGRNNDWTLTSDQIWVSNLGWRSNYMRRQHEASKKNETKLPNDDKEDHSRPHAHLNPLHPQAKLLMGGAEAKTLCSSPIEKVVPTTGKNSTGGTSTASSGGRTIDRIPRDACVSKGPGGSLRVRPFDRARPLITIEVTDEVIAAAETLANRKNDRGERLLSKKKLKKFRCAHWEWKQEELKKKQLAKSQETLAAAIKRCEEGLEKIPMIH